MGRGLYPAQRLKRFQNRGQMIISEDINYRDGFVVMQRDRWLAADSDGEWFFTDDFDSRFVFESAKVANETVKLLERQDFLSRVNYRRG